MIYLNSLSSFIIGLPNGQLNGEMVSARDNLLTFSVHLLPDSINVNVSTGKIVLTVIDEIVRRGIYFIRAFDVTDRDLNADGQNPNILSQPHATSEQEPKALVFSVTITSPEIMLPLHNYNLILHVGDFQSTGKTEGKDLNVDVNLSGSKFVLQTNDSAKAIVSDIESKVQFRKDDLNFDVNS